MKAELYQKAGDIYMEYLVITNNPMSRDLVIENTKHKLEFIDGSVQAVISKCEEVFLEGNYFLAADPMGGRRARPFPYLTLILEKGGPAAPEHWERINDYAELNAKRINQYINNSEALNSDYRVLDWSFTKTALKIY